MFLDQSFPPDSRVENEAFSLIGTGHEVHLFSLERDSNRPKREIWNGIEVHRFEISDLTYRLSALAYTVPFYHQSILNSIIVFIKAVNPDVLHIHDMLIAKAVFKANASFNIKTVLDLHENRPEIMQFYPHLKRFPGKHLIKPLVWKKWQKRLMNMADDVILVTHEAREVAVNEDGIEPSKITVVPNSIEAKIYYQYKLKPQIQDRFKDHFNIVYVGDTGLRRGTDTAIQALALLGAKIPDAQLILVGKSTEDSQLKELADTLGVKERVVFEGWQDVSLFPSYIAAANVCISPLHRNKHHDTTFANKIFQYMAGAKPLLVSDCPPQARVVNQANCGLIFQAENAKDMAEKLLQLYDEKENATSLGGNGKSALDRQFDWSITSKGLIELYSNIL
ncbi:glycosyltransferase involved in cell wall biosynthesis [Roseivirga ehrenbergii]|nr:glycosyltransferase involved in cell wall biosynthesis [Roseivirga ehrenbergii]